MLRLAKNDGTLCWYSLSPWLMHMSGGWLLSGGIFIKLCRSMSQAMDFKTCITLWHLPPENPAFCYWNGGRGELNNIKNRLGSSTSSRAIVSWQEIENDLIAISDVWSSEMDAFCLHSPSMAISVSLQTTPSVSLSSLAMPFPAFVLIFLGVSLDCLSAYNHNLHILQTE